MLQDVVDPRVELLVRGELVLVVESLERLEETEVALDISRSTLDTIWRCLHVQSR